MSLRVGLVFLVSVLIGGCSVVAESPLNMKGMMAADGMALVTTGKTVSDHILSFASGKNCSTVRRQIGQNFCEEDDLSEPEEIYCYNSLGDADCYTTPQPFGQGNKTIDHVSGKGDLFR